VIYLDTCLIVYAFEDDSERGIATRRHIAEQVAEEFVISPLVKMECLVGPIEDGNLEMRQYYEQGLARFGQVPLGEDVFLRAADLRARHGLKAPDAIHLAAAQIHQCSALWTNDDRLATAGLGLAVRVP
jgi:predicted nucleic acid-binding protein